MQVYQNCGHCTFGDSECEIGQGFPLSGNDLHLPQVNDPVAIISSVLGYLNRLEMAAGEKRSKGKKAICTSLLGSLEGSASKWMYLAVYQTDRSKMQMTL